MPFAKVIISFTLTHISGVGFSSGCYVINHNVKYSLVFFLAKTPVSDFQALSHTVTLTSEPSSPKVDTAPGIHTRFCPWAYIHVYLGMKANH